MFSKTFRKFKIHRFAKKAGKLPSDHPFHNEFKNSISASHKKLLTALHDQKVIKKNQEWDASDEEGGEIKYGLFPYWIENLENELGHISPVLKKLIRIFEPDEFKNLLASDEYKEIKKTLEERGGIVLSDGTPVGFGKYQALDFNWIYVPIHYYYTKITGKKVPFKLPPRDKTPVALQGTTAGRLRIALIGDWGTGNFSEDNQGDSPAVAIARQIEKMETPVDYLIHLGDVYYAGTSSRKCFFHSTFPDETVKKNFLDFLPKLPGSAGGKYFALNSNHEMLAGGYGLVHDAYKDSRFQGQNGSTCFALTFGEWTILGLDSAYFDESSFFDMGSFGSSTGRQADWIKSLSFNPEKTIIMTHHNAFNASGNIVLNKTSPDQSLWGEMKKIFADRIPAFWYWGHLHNGFVYKPFESVRCRCIGNSAIPNGISSDAIKAKDKFEYFANTPVSKDSKLLLNQFAVLTFEENGGLLEEIYNVGNNSPVWHSFYNPSVNR